VSELLVLVGTFKERPFVAAAAFAGVVFTLVYVLKLAQGVLFGKAAHAEGHAGPGGPAAPWADASARELAILSPLALTVLALGFAPQTALDFLRGPALTLLAQWSR